jgi:phytoene dehydrogenase-like protein
VPWLAEDARRAGVVHVGGPLADLAVAQQQAANGRLPDRPTLVVGQHSVHDPSRAPAGQHTLYVYARVPQRPELGEDEQAARVQSRIEELAPGFGELVRDRAIRTPQTLERENANLVGGDLAAGSMSLDQQFVFRPDPRLFRYRTPVDGLYVAGGSTYPGPGVNGVSGRGAADALLADLRLRRVRP